MMLHSMECLSSELAVPTLLFIQRETDSDCKQCNIDEDLIIISAN